MSLVAVTGGMGAGKSTVLKIFQRLGAMVLDADQLVHQLYEPGQPAWQAIIQHWGEKLLRPDSGIDRKQLAKIVFAKVENSTWLNALLHPLARKIILQQAALAENKLLYCAIPLLFESGWASDADYVVAVWCSPEVQQLRLQQRGWSQTQIAERQQYHLSMDEKLRRSDYGIISSCSRENLELQCSSLHQLLSALK